MNPKLIFEWLSKHWAIISAIFGLSFFTFVIPVLQIQVHIPIWLLIIIVAIPFIIYRAYIFYFRVNAKFKNGESVKLKNHSAVFFVIGYQLFSKKMVICKDVNGTESTYHQDSLSIYDPDKDDGNIYSDINAFDDGRNNYI